VARPDLAASLKTELNDFGSRTPVQSDLEQHPPIAVGSTGPASIDKGDHAAQALAGKLGTKASSQSQATSALHCGSGTCLDAQTFKRQRLPEKQQESESFSQQSHARRIS